MFSLKKCGKIWKNLPFFRAATAGLEKYRMGGYGRIMVYRVNYDSIGHHVYNLMTIVIIGESVIFDFDSRKMGSDKKGEWYTGTQIIF